MSGGGVDGADVDHRHPRHHVTVRQGHGQRGAGAPTSVAMLARSRDQGGRLWPNVVEEGVRTILARPERATEMRVVMEGDQLMVAAIVTRGGQGHAVREVGNKQISLPLSTK